MSIFKTTRPEKVRLRPGSPWVQATQSEQRTSAPTAVVESSQPAATTDAGAYLDAGSRISGKLYFERSAGIDGQVEGEINSDDKLVIGRSAVIAAQIKAQSVVVSGEVRGDIVAIQRIEMLATSRVLGNIISPILVVHEGALFEGRCAMQPDGHDDRGVSVVPKSA